MRIVLTINDFEYGHIPHGEIRAYIHLALESWGGGGDPNDQLFFGLKTEINILGDDDVNILVDGETGEIISGMQFLNDKELLVLEKKIAKQRGN